MVCAMSYNKANEEESYLLVHAVSMVTSIRYTQSTGPTGYRYRYQVRSHLHSVSKRYPKSNVGQ